jgi:hypothetical protein
MHEEDFGLGHTTADAEILSSNTKKVPDSPHAESTAISGHADQEEVHREKHRADLETAKSDPFQRRGSKMPTTFLRKLTGESSGSLDPSERSTNDSVEATPLDVPDRVIDLDDDTTLFGDLRLRSSPPIPDSSSIQDAYSDVSSPQTSRADEIEWEAALQRDLHERTSKRVVRNLADSETAVTGIADVPEEDGERLHLERQCGESAEAFQELASKE